MRLQVEPFAIYNMLSGLLLIVLGAWLLRVRPRTRASLRLGVFAAAFGFVWFSSYLFDPDPAEIGLILWPGVAAQLIAAGAVLQLARVFPAGPELRDRGTWRWAALGGSLFVAPAVLASALRYGRARLTPEPLATTYDITRSIMVGALVTVVLLWTLRAARARDRAERAQHVLASAALSLYPAMVVGLIIGFAARGLASDPRVAWLQASSFLFAIGFLAAMAVLWLRLAARSPAQEARGPRNVALLVLGMAALAMATIIPLGTTAGGGPAPATARTLSVGILAFAILRHQLLGIDVRVRWTIKQSTVAAVFIGVFFVVSEAAQQFFSSNFGPYLGIAAAGGLVFALAPLQHFAERVASAALPDARAPKDLDAGQRSELYLRLARQAWSDDVMTRDERAMLDAARTELGLSADEAMRLEREASARPG